MLAKLLAPLALSALLLAGCGGDDEAADEGTTTTEAAAETTTSAVGEDEGTSHTDASAEELERWQADLDAVGCWAGPVDGELGPQTEAAIEAFQAAEGLEVDGLLGPKTEAALADAAAAGEIVCTTETPGATTVPGGSEGSGRATLSAPSYDNAFTIGSCTSSGETQITLQGQVNDLTLTVDASGGQGTLAVSGGTEGDGVTLNGDVSSVQVGDTGDFTVEGTFTAPTDAGEAFTLTGSCA